MRNTKSAGTQAKKKIRLLKDGIAQVQRRQCLPPALAGSHVAIVAKHLLDRKKQAFAVYVWVIDVGLCHRARSPQKSLFFAGRKKHKCDASEKSPCSARNGFSSGVATQLNCPHHWAMVFACVTYEYAGAHANR